MCVIFSYFENLLGNTARTHGRVGKNPGFFKKTQPGGFFWVLLGFFGFYWVLLGFFNFRQIKLFFFPIYGISNYFKAYNSSKLP
jgi:hypothetical protein